MFYLKKHALFAGKFLGRLAFIFLRNRKKIALSNIKRVFNDLSDEEIKAIAKSNFEKLGINVIEFLLMPFIRDRQIPERFTVEGKEFFEEALHKGKGVIALWFSFRQLGGDRYYIKTFGTRHYRSCPAS